MSSIFDIVILVGPNELSSIHKQLEYTKKHVLGFRNIYIICYDPTVNIEGCIMIQESAFPFSLTDVADYFRMYNGKSNRNNWYFQQLLKLYCGFVIPDILDHFLIIDADVYFLKPIQFFEIGRPFINLSNNYPIHQPYIHHLSRLHPCFKQNVVYSGISHHMMFQKDLLKELFIMVESHHGGLPFWRVFLDMVDEHKKYPADAIESGASEYEIYFHFIAYFHPDKIVFRKLKWDDKPNSFDFNHIESISYDYISICHWM